MNTKTEFATGGYVGPNTAVGKDDVCVVLSRGDFELPAETVQKYGGLFKMLNDAAAVHQLRVETIRRISKELDIHPTDVRRVLERFAPAKEREVSDVSSKWAIVIGSPVIYVDSLGKERPALITNMFGPADKNPSINVVVVNDDEKQTDSYGQKIERFTSVPHQDQQYAHGNYWKPINE